MLPIDFFLVGNELMIKKYLEKRKKSFNHIEMGIYLVALDGGKIEIGNKIEVKN